MEQSSHSGQIWRFKIALCYWPDRPNMKSGQALFLIFSNLLWRQRYPTRNMLPYKKYVVAANVPDCYIKKYAAADVPYNTSVPYNTTVNRPAARTDVL